MAPEDQTVELDQALPKCEDIKVAAEDATLRLAGIFSTKHTCNTCSERVRIGRSVLALVRTFGGFFARSSQLTVHWLMVMAQMRFTAFGTLSNHCSTPVVVVLVLVLVLFLQFVFFGNSCFVLFWF